MRILNARDCFREPINIGHRGENGVTQIRFQIPSDLLTWSYTVYVRRPGEVDSYPAANIARQDGSIVWTVSDVDTGNAGKGEVQIRYTSGTNKEKTMVYPTFTDKSIDMSPGDIPDAYETWLDALTELAETTHTNAENAAESEQNAKTSEDNAKASEEAAAESERKAKISEDHAKTSEDNAKASEDNAKTSEEKADGYAEDAEAWAVGKRNNVDVGSEDPTYQNNSKWYAERSADAGGFAWFEVNNETGEAVVTVTDKLAEDVSFAVNTTTGTLEVTVA